MSTQLLISMVYEEDVQAYEMYDNDLERPTSRDPYSLPIVEVFLVVSEYQRPHEQNFRQPRVDL